MGGSGIDGGIGDGRGRSNCAGDWNGRSCDGVVVGIDGGREAGPAKGCVVVGSS